MDLRRVQLTGGSSITVTLPKAWVDKVKLQPGDVVGCRVQPDGSLAVHAHARGDRGTTRYVIPVGDAASEHLFRKIIAAYLMGYDMIVLSAKSPLTPETRVTIRDAVNRIMGLEIVEEEPNAITVQDFLDPRLFHMEKILRRMSILTQAMQEEALKALDTPDADAVRSIEDRDDEVDRLYWLVNKQYHAMLRDVSYAAKMELTASQALNFLLVARLVERTADHARRIAVEANAIPNGDVTDAFRAQLTKEGRRAGQLFRDSVAQFLKKGVVEANRVIDEAGKFQRAHHGKLLKEATTFGSEPVSHLVVIIESIGRTAAYAADIGEVTINHQVASAADGGRSH